MKICLASTSALESLPFRDGYAGIETYVGCLAKWFDEHGHEVHLFATENSYKPKNGKLHAFRKADVISGQPTHPQQFFQDFWDDAECRDILRSADIVNDHGHYHPFKFLKINGFQHRYMLSLHSMIPDKFLPQGKFCNVGQSFLHSRWMAKFTNEEWRTILEGVNIDVYPFSGEERENRLLWVSRIWYPKGPDRAINIAEKVKMPIDIVGGEKFHGDDKFVEHIKERCEKSDYANYIGEVDHKTKVNLYQKAKAVLLPLRTHWNDPDGTEHFWVEPFGMIAPEANACGTPIICSPNGGLMETVTHGYNGFFANTEDEFVSAIRKVDELNHFSIRKRVEDYLTIDRVAKDFIILYEEVANGKEW